MSGLAVFALLAAAAKALPNGTPAERAAWCKARERDFTDGTPASPHRSPSTRGPVPFHEVADDPVIARLCREDER